MNKKSETSTLVNFFALLLNQNEKGNKTILNFANRMESLKVVVCLEVRDGETKRV